MLKKQNVLIVVIWVFEIVITVMSTNVSVKACQTRPYVEKWEKEYYPNPQNDTQEDYCGRGCKPSWICDPGHVITMEEADILEHKIEKIRSLEICGCSTCKSGKNGFTISVALVPRLYMETREENQAGETDAVKFVNHLRNTEWQFGSCDNDVVILLSAEQKWVEIASGKAVQNIIPDLKVIQDEANKKLLSQYKVYDVLNHMIIRIHKGIPDKTRDTSKIPSDRYGETLLVVVGAVCLLILIMVVSLFLQRKGYCRKMITYRIQVPSMTLYIPEPHRHYHEHDTKRESDKETTCLELAKK